MKRIFFYLFACSCTLGASYHSQYRQDQILNDCVFKNKRNGFFVEIGAYDGVKYSNTKFYEDHLEWKGICIEPVPEHFALLEENRPNAICVNACVASEEGLALFQRIFCDSFQVEMLSGLIDKYSPRHLERSHRETDAKSGRIEIIEVPCVRLDALLDEHGIQHIDYLSIDTEGNEMDILQSIDFDRFDITVVGVENNYQAQDFQTFLEEKGYTFFGYYGDEIYVKR